MTIIHFRNKHVQHERLHCVTEGRDAGFEFKSGPRLLPAGPAASAPAGSPTPDLLSQRLHCHTVPRGFAARQSL